MFKKIALSLGLLAFALSAQAKKPEPLTVPLAPRLPVEVVLMQQELGVDVSNTGAAITAAAVGGIVGALIGAGITKAQVAKAEKRVVNLRNELIDYDFNARFEDAIRQTLDDAQASPELQVKLVHEVGNLNDPVGSGLTAEPAILQVVPRYSIDAGFEAIKVSMTVTLLERRAKSNGKLKQVWRAMRNYSFVLPIEKVAGNSPEQDAARWEAMGGEHIAGLLDQGIAQINAMLAFDLSAEGVADAQLKNKGSNPIAGRNYPGRKVREGEGWQWLRTGKHWFTALQGVQPISAPAVTAEGGATDQAAPADTTGTATSPSP